MTLILVAGALALIGVVAFVMFRALAATGGSDASRADAERIAELPVAIVTARVAVEVVQPKASLAPLTSTAVRGDPAVFVATLWPGIDSDDLTDDDHVDDDHDSDDDNDDVPEEADDEVLDAVRRRREMIATAFAAIVGLAARGSLRLAIERVERVVDPADPGLPSAGLAPRGLLVRRLVDAPFDNEAGLELGILGQLPLAVDVPIAELREVLEAIHLEPPLTTDARALAEHLGAFVVDHDEVWHELRASLQR